MKTVAIGKQARAVNALLDKARRDDVLVRAADGSEFLLTAVDDFDEEIARARQNEKLMHFLQRRATEPASLSLDAVKARLGFKSPRKQTSR